MQAASAFLGNYLGQICPDNTINCVTQLYVAIAAANVGGTTNYAFGCAINSTNASEIPAAVALAQARRGWGAAGPVPSRITSLLVSPAQASDIVILALGIDGSIEGEAHDRSSITLPGQQNALAAAIAAVGKPTVLVAVNGGTVDYTQVRHRLP